MSQERGNVVNMPVWTMKTRDAVLERLFAEHGQPVRDFLIARTGAQPGGSRDLDDIVQEVFVRLLAKDNLQDILAEKSGSTRAWLFTVANNLMLDIKRRDVLSKRFTAEMAREQQVQPITPERILESAQDLARVKAAVMQLPPKCRKVFLMSRYQNLSYRQIAAQMNLSVKQIEKYMSQALAKTRAAALEAAPHRRGSTR